jgi:hypothetical protein
VGKLNPRFFIHLVDLLGAGLEYARLRPLFGGAGRGPYARHDGARHCFSLVLQVLLLVTRPLCYAETYYSVKRDLL